MDQYIGKLLDNRYEILEVIGTGGMAVVYKARCNRLNRLVAIKALKQELSQDEEFRRRFYAESQAVAMLSHPNIVSVYDVAHSDGLDYIVMELIDGITLKQYMEQKGQLNWREALHFATQIAKALEHAHSRGIVHRDIKPHNIMILKDGSVKVADFGIARISSAQNTLTREALGSVHYISPEQAKGAHVDARSDLYSLGVVMYEMLTGRPPFDGDTPVSVAIQHINATPVLPRELNPNIPLGLEQITMHAMTADLNKRYKSATEMLADLEEFRKDPNTTFDFTHRQGGIDMERLLHDPDYLPKSLGVSAAKNRAKKAIAGKKQEREAPKAQNAPKADAPEKRGSRIAVIAGIVCIALALCGIGYFLYSYLSDLFATTKEDVVPNFVGAYYEDIDASQYPNFKIEVGDWRTSDSVEYGRVISQTPDAERTVKVGTTILLTVSSGVSSDTMPPLVNQTVQAAQTALNALSVQVTVNIEYETSTTFTDRSRRGRDADRRPDRNVDGVRRCGRGAGEGSGAAGRDGGRGHRGYQGRGPRAGAGSLCGERSAEGHGHVSERGRGRAGEGRDGHQSAGLQRPGAGSDTVRAERLTGCRGRAERGADAARRGRDERQRHAELCVVRVGERERRRREPRLAQRGGQRQLHRGHEPDGHVLLFL